MSWPTLILNAAALTFLAVSAPSAVAGGYWRFYISVDGKPAFTGGSGVTGEFSPLDHLETSVRGGVQRGVDSFLGEDAAGDITLTGDVVFRDQQHPPFHMTQLRLVYEKDMADRLSGTTVAGGYYDWRLHPEDAALIVAHYRNSEKTVTTNRRSKVVGLILVPAAIAIFVIFSGKWRRLKDQRESLSLPTESAG